VKVDAMAEQAAEAEEEKRKVATPKVGTVDDVSKFLSIPKAKILKSLVYVANEELVLAVVRGDHGLNEIRLARALGVDEVFIATDADVQKATGAAVGFAGPVGFAGRVLVDRAAAQVKNAATGANETDQHFTGVNLGRDWHGEIVDIRLATTGDPCPHCEGGKLTSYRGIEAGHIFILGTRYSAQMRAHYSDERQESKPIVMGCYGIGVSRLVATAIEQNHDENGIKWPMSIAPYPVHLVTLAKDDNICAAAKNLYDVLTARGIDVLWDDRDERPGVKFKDADLLGMPLRITIGAKSLASGSVELKPRTEPDPKKAELVPLIDAAGVVETWVEAALVR
jgi:prolyl-tRNA synthetase